MNYARPDCGWDPYVHQQFKTVLAADLAGEDGFDLANQTNMHCDLSAESANVQIQSFKNMVNGKMYMLGVKNGSAKQLEVLLPSENSIFSSTVTPANGMKVMYKFWTDGENIYCDRAIYK